MKLLEYPLKTHPKNVESMARMCAIFNIEYERTNERKRLNKVDYDILWLPTEWCSPDEFPGIKILYGPNHFVFPKAYVVGSPNEEWSSRCVFTCLSNWVKEVYEEFSHSFVIPMMPLPFSIMELPPRILDNSPLSCIVYFKRRKASDQNLVLELLKKKNISYTVFSYGSYKDSDYQTALAKSKFVVWCGSHESQGFAFEECLARNIPILNFDATSMFEEEKTYEYLRGDKILASTTAPYWDPMCGEKVTDPEMLESYLTKLLENIEDYTPAKYIRETLSDRACMQRILDALHIKIRY